MATTTRQLRTLVSIPTLVKTGGTGDAGMRLGIVEAVRGIAACCIVLHHLSAYGEIPDVAGSIAPSWMQFFYDDLRKIVAVFFVLGGFALAWSNSTRPWTWNTLASNLALRYLRLTIPYSAMLVLLVSTAWLTSSLSLTPPAIDSFSWPQLLAHTVFLQDVLGYDNFSAGTWYLCIDMQFAIVFGLTSALMCAVISRRFNSAALPTLMASLLIPLGIWSAWSWNRDARLEPWIFYYLCAIIPGALAAWWLRGRIHGSLLVIYWTVAGSSLLVDYRPRLSIALIAASLLLVAPRFKLLERLSRLFTGLGRISYSLFLIHYLVNWAVLAAMRSWVGSDAPRAWLALATAFATSIVAALIMHFTVERPALKWIDRLRSHAPNRSRLADPLADSPSPIPLRGTTR